MRSQRADEVLQRIRSQEVPYDVTFDGITVRVDQDVYPTGELSTLMGECIRYATFGVKAGDAVLDYGTGTGYLAIVAALNGAERVVAIDINPAAVNCARANVKKYHLEDKISVRQGDGLSAIQPQEKFNCIFAGMPWEDAVAQDMLERSVYDPGYVMRKDLFDHANDILIPGGKIFTTWSQRMQTLQPIEYFDDRYQYEMLVRRDIKTEPHYVYMISRKKVDSF